MKKITQDIEEVIEVNEEKNVKEVIEKKKKML